MRRLGRALWGLLSDQAQQDAFIAAGAVLFVQVYLRRLHERVRQLEDEAALRDNLKHLEDVATLADLAKLERRVELVEGKDA